ncbi:hypothetical protein EMIT0111MI5_30512 [Burkholderia sp. IT-111MI5]
MHEDEWRQLFYGSVDRGEDECDHAVPERRVARDGWQYAGHVSDVGGLYREVRGKAVDVRDIAHVVARCGFDGMTDHAAAGPVPARRVVLVVVDHVGQRMSRHRPMRHPRRAAGRRSVPFPPAASST